MATFNVTNSNDSGQGSLREAIEMANLEPGIDDIFIQSDVQLSSEIDITESVNIGTPFGSTITQTEDSRIFNIDDNDTEQDSEVSLYRLNLTGGNADLGGAIISYENLTITDSSLYGNSAETDGAAIYGVGADLNIERSEFYDNQITSVEEISDRDIFVFSGKLEVVNSNLDTVEEPTLEATEEIVVEQPTVDEAVSEATAMEEVVDESAIEDESEVTSEATVTEEVVDESAIETTSPEMEAEFNDTFLVGDDANDTLSGGAGNDTILGGDGANSIEGMAGDDNLLGGKDGDVFLGSDGDDTINGSDGDDNLSGNDGNDILNGDAGVDLLDGGAGDDNLNGGADSDFLQDSSGDNILFGNDGSDRIIGGRDLDYLNGGEGDDDLYGGDGDDTLSGETGDDTLDGAGGNDTLLGSEGNDLIRGAGGNDVIHGHAGDDYLLGSTEDDILHGDEGNDTLSGDGGNNFLLGGDGNDLFNLITEGNNVVADFELGIDRLQLSQISYGDLDITGDTNSILSYQDSQIGMVMGVNPVELTQDSFVEV